MKKTLMPKFGLWTAVAMVVGIVIGSGIFFKSDNVLIATGGSLPFALLAWVIGGVIMLVSVYAFSFAAARVLKSNGIIDYIEAGYGKRGGYYIGWFVSWIYYPSLVGVLAWISGLYTTVLFNLAGGVDPSNASSTWIFAAVYMIAAFVLNFLSPILSGKFQVSAMVIKLVPVSLVAIVGTIVGISNGVTAENFVNAAHVTAQASGSGLAVAVLATAFAYDGWSVALSINSELREAKRNLPKALVIGSLIVMAAYILYNLGIAGVLANQQSADLGDGAVTLAVQRLFGPLAGTALTVFVIVSCLGTLNGLTLAATRGLYSIAFRGKGLAPRLFVQVTDKSNTPLFSVIGGAVISIAWSVIWYGNFQGWWGGFMDISVLPIAILYGIFVAIYIWIMRDFKDVGPFKRYVVPGLAIIGSLYIVYAALQTPLFINFLLICLFILSIGMFTEIYHIESDKAKAHRAAELAMANKSGR